MYKVCRMRLLCLFKFGVEPILNVSKSVLGLVTESFGVLCQHFSMFVCNPWHWHIECSSLLLRINVEAGCGNCRSDMTGILRSWGDVDYKQLWTLLNNLLTQNNRIFFTAELVQSILICDIPSHKSHLCINTAWRQCQIILIITRMKPYWPVTCQICPPWSVTDAREHH